MEFNTEKELEKFIDSWTDVLDQGLKTQRGLLEIALAPYDLIFEKDINGDPIYKHLEKKQAKELLESIDLDVIPLYEEHDYKEGLKNAPVTGTTKPGESGGSESTGGGKIVCTMMNESYGFGSFRNKIWMKFHKDLSPEYQKGYHRLFLPLVKIAKTNKIIKNILEHIAVHSTIDMRQSMRGKKHLLGRLYRKILLPICYWAGKK